MQASESVGAGEQVLISYGTRSNDQLLQFYGFVEESNQDDLFEVPGLWSKLQAAAGQPGGGGDAASDEESGYVGWGGLEPDGMERAVRSCGSADKAKAALAQVPPLTDSP